MTRVCICLRFLRRFFGDCRRLFVRLMLSLGNNAVALLRACSSIALTLSSQSDLIRLKIRSLPFIQTHLPFVIIGRGLSSYKVGNLNYNEKGYDECEQSVNLNQGYGYHAL